MKTSPLYRSLAQGILESKSPKEILDCMIILESLQGKPYESMPSFQKLFREVYSRGCLSACRMILDMGVVPDSNTLHMLHENHPEMLKGRIKLASALPFGRWSLLGEITSVVLEVLPSKMSLMEDHRFTKHFPFVFSAPFLLQLERAGARPWSRIMSCRLDSMTLDENFPPESFPSLYASVKLNPRHVAKWGKDRLAPWVVGNENTVAALCPATGSRDLLICEDRNTPAATAYLAKVAANSRCFKHKSADFSALFTQISTASFSDYELESIRTGYLENALITLLASKLPDLDKDFKRVFLSWLKHYDNWSLDLPFLWTSLNFHLWLSKQDLMSVKLVNKRNNPHGDWDPMMFSQASMNKKLAKLWASKDIPHKALWDEMNRIGYPIASVLQSLQTRSYLPAHFECLGTKPSTTSLMAAIRAGSVDAVNFHGSILDSSDLKPLLLMCFETGNSAVFDAVASHNRDPEMEKKIAELRPLLAEVEDEMEEGREASPNN